MSDVMNTAAPAAAETDGESAESDGGGLSLREAAARLTRMTDEGRGLDADDTGTAEDAQGTDALPPAPRDDGGDDDDDVPQPLPDAQPPEDVTHTVKVDGAEQAVTLDELKAGYQRQGDYTRKTQALAAERRQLLAERAQYAETLGRLSQDLALSGNGPPDQKLFEANPAEYIRQTERWRNRQALANTIAAEQARMSALQERAMEQEQAQTLAVEEHRMAAAIPGWSDPQARERGKFELASYLARTYGATAQELATFSDHRLMVLGHKAMLYDRLMSQRPLAEKRVRGLPRVQKPGTARTQREMDQAQAKILRDRFKKTGSIRDAAKLLNFLGD